MTMRLAIIFCTLASTSYISATAPLHEQPADVAFLGGVEQKHQDVQRVKLQDVQRDFSTGIQLCFDPFLLEPPKKVVLDAIKRMWATLVYKTESRIAANALQEAVVMVIIMDKFVCAMKQMYQKIQLCAVGKDQSPYALVKVGFTLNQQQDVMLSALASLADIINAHVKTPQAALLIIDNELISSLVLDACKLPASYWRLWHVGKEQELVSKLVSVDLWAQYDFIAQAYYTCLFDYYNLFANADVATPEAAKKKLEVLADTFRKTLGHIAITTDNVEYAETRQVLDYITSHLEKILAELETCCSFAEQPMLVELFALHCAIVGSPGFVLVQNREQKLAESYARLAGIFFRKQPSNVLFLGELHTAMQRIKFLSNAKKPHEPVGLKDCIIKFIQAVSALILGTSKEPMLDTLDQMLVVMHAATEWHGNERKQASTLMEWLLPASVRNHPAVKNVLLNNNIITHVAALGIVPAGYKLIEMFFGKKEQPADQHIKDLLQLAKDNPAAYADLVAQNPAIRERLAAHFAPVAVAS